MRIKGPFVSLRDGHYRSHPNVDAACAAVVRWQSDTGDTSGKVFQLTEGRLVEIPLRRPYGSRSGASGRPKCPEVRVHLSPESYDWVTEQSESAGVSRGAVVREVVERVLQSVARTGGQLLI